LERERSEKTLQLEQVRKGAVKLALAQDSEVRRRLEEAAKQIGFERLAENVEQLEEALKEFRSASGRVP
jgi:hypothetical protein